MNNKSIIVKVSEELHTDLKIKLFKEKKTINEYVVELLESDMYRKPIEPQKEVEVKPIPPISVYVPTVIQPSEDPVILNEIMTNKKAMEHEEIQRKIPASNNINDSNTSIGKSLFKKVGITVTEEQTEEKIEE